MVDHLARQVHDDRGHGHRGLCLCGFCHGPRASAVPARRGALSPRHDQLLTGVCTGAELQGTHQVLGSAIGVATIVQASVGSFIHSFTPEERRHHALATTYHKVRPFALSSGKSWKRS